MPPEERAGTQECAPEADTHTDMLLAKAAGLGLRLVTLADLAHEAKEQLCGPTPTAVGKADKDSAQGFYAVMWDLLVSMSERVESIEADVMAIMG